MAEIAELKLMPLRSQLLKLGFYPLGQSFFHDEMGMVVSFEGVDDSVRIAIDLEYSIATGCGSSPEAIHAEVTSGFQELLRFLWELEDWLLLSYRYLKEQEVKMLSQSHMQGAPALEDLAHSAS